jgi:DNA-binding transcriptional ArsR family regulator
MATLDRYRVLNAILALREFTVADLAHYSGVKKNTVQTVLGRDARFVERDGVVAQGRRGGQPIRYQLRAEAEGDLAAILRQLEGLGASVPPLLEDTGDLHQVALSLISAEDILLRQFPQARPADWPGLISLASADYDAVPPLTDSDTRTHRRVVELLLRLAEIEQEAIAQTSPAPDTSSPERPPRGPSTEFSHELEKKLEVLGQDLRKLLQCWPQLRDKNLLPDLMERIGTSRFAQQILRRH